MSPSEGRARRETPPRAVENTREGRGERGAQCCERRVAGAPRTGQLEPNLGAGPTDSSVSALEQEKSNFGHRTIGQPKRQGNGRIDANVKRVHRGCHSRPCSAGGKETGRTKSGRVSARVTTPTITDPLELLRLDRESRTCLPERRRVPRTFAPHLRQERVQQARQRELRQGALLL